MRSVPYADITYDGWRLPSGHDLVSAHEWVRELSPDGRIAWEYRVQKPVELTTCIPLPGGDVMTVDGERMELIQLADQGRRIVRRIPVPTDPKASIHARYNLLRRTAAGTYLLALRAEQAFVEVDDSGRELWRHAVPGLPVGADAALRPRDQVELVRTSAVSCCAASAAAGRASGKRSPWPFPADGRGAG